MLVKPASRTKWDFEQVSEVKDKKVDVKFADGKTRTVKAGDFIVLN